MLFYFQFLSVFINLSFESPFCFSLDLLFVLSESLFFFFSLFQKRVVQENSDATANPARMVSNVQILKSFILLWFNDFDLAA